MPTPIPQEKMDPLLLGVLNVVSGCVLRFPGRIYKLEHTIEHNRERQFITTMIGNLKNDTMQLSQNINYRKTREAME